MNQQNLGDAASLTKYDICFHLLKSLNLPFFYVAMVTEPKPANESKNAINYRLGHKNEALLNLISTARTNTEVSQNEVADFFSNSGIDTSLITIRNKQKSNHHRIGYVTYFNDKERQTYFDGVCELLQPGKDYLILLDPDVGLYPKNTVPPHRRTLMVSQGEIRKILEKVSENSVVLVYQSLANVLYSVMTRVQDLKTELEYEVMMIADEVLQAGLFIITKNANASVDVRNRLNYYFSGYTSMNKSQRILFAYTQDNEIIISSIGNLSENIQE